MAHKQGEPGCSIVVCMARIESTASTPVKCMAWTGDRCIKFLHGKNVAWQLICMAAPAWQNKATTVHGHRKLVDMVEQCLAPAWQKLSTALAGTSCCSLFHDNELHLQHIQACIPENQSKPLATDAACKCCEHLA